MAERAEGTGVPACCCAVPAAFLGLLAYAIIELPCWRKKYVENRFASALSKAGS